MGPAERWQERIDAVEALGMGPQADASVGRWLTPRFAQRSPAAVERLKVMLQRTDPAGYAGCCAAIRDLDLRPSVHRVRCPVLVIGGDEDPAASTADAEFLARQTSGELVILKAAHLSNVEKPQAFTAAVTDFLQR
jgi:3-oxoadipate enol-lactonase